MTGRLIYACRLDRIFEKRREESVIHHLLLLLLLFFSFILPPHSFHGRFLLRKRRPCQPHTGNVIGVRYHPSPPKKKVLNFSTSQFAMGSTKPLSHSLCTALPLLLRSHSPVFLSQLFHRSCTSSMQAFLRRELSTHWLNISPLLCTSLDF